MGRKLKHPGRAGGWDLLSVANDPGVPVDGAEGTGLLGLIAGRTGGELESPALLRGVRDRHGDGLGLARAVVLDREVNAPGGVAVWPHRKLRVGVTFRAHRLARERPAGQTRFRAVPFGPEKRDVGKHTNAHCKDPFGHTSIH